MKITWLIAGLMVLVSELGTAEEKKQDKVVAQVGKEKITLAEVQNEIGRLGKSPNFADKLGTLTAEGSPGLLSGEVKGAYDLAGKKADFAGNLKHPEGDWIPFTATIRDQDFSVQFNSEGLNLDTVLELLPEPWRKRINPQKYQADKKNCFRLCRPGNSYPGAGRPENHRQFPDTGA